MNVEQNSKNESGQLQDRVVLIINGLSERGQVLARMLSKQGADIAIAHLEQKPEITLRIQQEVEANGRRILMLTPQSLLSDKPIQFFSKQAIKKIVDIFGHLDAFVAYSTTKQQHKIIAHRKQNNGHLTRSFLFDENGLTKAAVKQILSQ